MTSKNSGFLKLNLTCFKKPKEFIRLDILKKILKKERYYINENL